MTTDKGVATTAPVLVGVDGSAAALRAVDVAAHEAARRGSALRVLHVIPVVTPLPLAYAVPFPLPSESSHQIGQSVLADAATRAEAVLGPDRVTVHLAEGDRARALLTAARHASLLVLGNERRNLLDRLITGTVINNAAAHSPVPVVVVPEGWAPESERRHLVVGIKDCSACEGLVRRALELAAARQARVTLLNAWEFPVLYDPSAYASIDFAAVAEASRAELAKHVGPLVAEFPGIEVDIRVEQGQAARLLTLASAEADLLMIERRGHLLPVGHLGGTARAVLRESACPVEVLPAASEYGLERLEVEAAGVPLKAALGVEPG